MRVTIDNLDGLGAIDYSDQMMGDGAVVIERMLNKPSTCALRLQDGLTRPARQGRVVIAGDDGTVLFTGYLTREPEVECTGAGVTGSVHSLRVAATSDDWLLDKQGLRVGGESFAEGGDALLANLTNRVDGSRFQTEVTGAIAEAGSFVANAGRTWSETAGAIADAAGASYRVIGGVVEMAPMGAVQHALTTADDSLSEAGLRLATTRALVNDVTLSGSMEAGAYITEIFVGDGTTAEFELAAVPFAGGGAASRTIVADDFSAGVLDRQRWGGGDPGSHLSLGAGGLVMTGGNGLDGQTTLVATSAVELGGTVLLEARSVSLGQGSDGVLLGLYSGAVSRADCVAGFDVRQANGTTTLGCLVNGATAGTTLTLASGHAYLLRIYLHATETQRVRQSYVVMVDGVPTPFGGGLVSAAVDVVFAVADMGVSSNTPATVLYDGTMASGPASVSFAPVNSVQLVGTVGEVQARRMAPMWVRGTTSAGAAVTRLQGATGTGADYAMTAGTLRFYAGRVPAAGETVTARYRLGQRSVARVQSAASMAAEAMGGLPGTSAWQGSVLQPTARSAEDCAAAASALLSVATSRTAAMAGTYKAVNLPDVWPGDLLALTTASGTTQVVARRVRLADAGAMPELVRWQVEMANDWAGGVSIKVSEALAADADVADAMSAMTTVAGLGGLQVVSVSQTVVQIDTGTTPPSGGGFEIRRRDGGFGPGTSGDLVLRSGVRGISIPRGAQVERFYVRMYDGSTPPVYSRLSSAIVTNVPVG